MQHSTRPRLLKGLEPLDGWDVRHPIMAARNHDGVEPLGPPVVSALALLAQRHLPLGADLLDALNRRVVRDKVLVAVPLDEPLDVAAHMAPVAEGGVDTVDG